MTPRAAFSTPVREPRGHPGRGFGGWAHSGRRSAAPEGCQVGSLASRTAHRSARCSNRVILYYVQPQVRHAVLPIWHPGQRALIIRRMPHPVILWRVNQYLLQARVSGSRVTVPTTWNLPELPVSHAGASVLSLLQGARPNVAAWWIQRLVLIRLHIW